MLRLLSMFVLAAALSLSTSVAAAVPDNGPPYTDAQFIALSAERLPNSFSKQSLAEWWARAPDYLRRHVLNSPSDRWWHIILCNFMGFKPNGVGAENSKKCEEDSYNASVRNKSNWAPDGTWLGPSEECRKRDKRSQWGELICD